MDLDVEGVSICQLSDSDAQRLSGDGRLLAVPIAHCWRHWGYVPLPHLQTSCWCSGQGRGQGRWSRVGIVRNPGSLVSQLSVRFLLLISNPEPPTLMPAIMSVFRSGWRAGFMVEGGQPMQSCFNGITAQ